MMSHFLRRGCLTLTLAVAGSVGLSATAHAQNPGDRPAQRGEGRGQGQRNGLMRMVEGLRTLVADLRLDDAQKGKVDQFLLSTRDEMQKIMQDPNTEPRDKAQAVRAKFEETTQSIRDVLTDEQKTSFDAGMEKLRADAMQNRGGGGMQLVQRVERALGTLDLADDQKTKTQAVLDETTTKLETLREEARSNGDPATIREKAQTLRDETIAKLAEVLTPEQMAKLREAMNADRPAAGREGRERAGPMDRDRDGMTPADGDGKPAVKNTTPDKPGVAAAAQPAPSTVTAIDVGQPLPAFSLMQLDGKSLTNASFAGKPAVILFGSYSSPALRDRIAKLQELADKNRNRAKFVLIYTAEMYPADAEQPTRNENDKISVAAHKTLDELMAAARNARDTLKIKLEIAADTMDGMLQQTLKIGANGAAVIKADGTLAFKQDWADAYALERALGEVIAK